MEGKVLDWALRALLLLISMQRGAMLEQRR
jgi:hypothetical protein